MQKDAFSRAKEEIDLEQFIRDHVGSDIIFKGSKRFISCPKAGDGDSDPSLCIYPHDNSFYCYHCGGDFYGTIIDFVKGWKDIDSNYKAIKFIDSLYPDLQLLDEEATRKSQLKSAAIEQMDYRLSGWEDTLSSNNDVLEALRASRGLTDDTIEQYRIGMSTDKWPRLQIPQLNKEGKPLAFVSRELSDADPRPRYLVKNEYVSEKDGRPIDPNTYKKSYITIWEKGSWLYGLSTAQETSANGTVYVVESQLDVLLMYELGLGAVATGGKALTAEQASFLAPFDSIVLVPDADALKVIPKNFTMIRKELVGKPIYVLPPWTEVPDVNDVGDIIKGNHMTHEELLEYIKDKAFTAELYVAQGWFSDVFDLMQYMTEPIGRARVTQYIADQIGVHPSTVIEAILYCNDSVRKE